jgi:CRISPR-associated protein Cas1
MGVAALRSWLRQIAPMRAVPTAIDFASIEPDDASPGEAHPSLIDAAPIHIISPDSHVRIEAGEIIVEDRSNNKSYRRGIEQVSAIHLFGGGRVTNSVVAELSRLGRPLIWRSPSGYPISCTQPFSPAGMEARKRQYSMAQRSEECTPLARALVVAKIVNMRGLLRRRRAFGEDRDGVGKKLSAMTSKARRANQSSLFGIEGAATRLYFSRFPYLLKGEIGADSFAGRTRSPPRDVVNASLSYLYAVLLGECVCALTAAGLDPRCGVYHRPRAGKPALALDLMEPFRPAVVDACVTAAMNAGRITADSGAIGDGGVMLTQGGKRAALTAIEDRFATEIRRQGAASPRTWRDQIHIDALNLAQSFRTGEAFIPMQSP